MIRPLAIILIVAGILGIVFQRFAYTKEDHKADLGPISFSVQEKKTVNIPQWAGIAAIVIGAGLLLVPAKKS
jgi:hypothetical protein